MDEQAPFDGSARQPLLRDFWYLALSGSKLARNAMQAVRLLGEPVLLCRGADSRVFALRDICPHRGMPLSYGRFDGREVECCYHGWRFAADGHCTAIPSLVPGQHMTVERIRCGTYPCREVQGNIWIYIAEPTAQARQADAPNLPPPTVPGLGDIAPQVAISQVFPCSADQAAFGLMDPTHAAFVHTSWWWKKQARKLRLKEKHFEPAPLGWRMKRHRLPQDNRAYRLLGRAVTTEITYSLPGLRMEVIKGERHSAAGLTAITPLSTTETEVHQALYCTLPWLAPLRPLGRYLANAFLTQDREVVMKQQDGLAHNPRLMLIDDADTQAKWFYHLKREWLCARAEGRPFENPIKECTLRWRS
ncbi:MAG TPA: aromatic ring-hydroxylating dioxygenase subunit alpha [Alphaproteobacteria bacterium]|nr:aromatic ring-hydroxylating dioxygenase subunit alpha [Alphaproteobacteria bacterium]